MLRTIRDFFDSRVADASNPSDTQHRLRIATAALIVEVMRVDGIDTAERDAVLRSIGDKFGLGDDEAQALVELGELEASAAVGYYQFTSLINEHFDISRKERIVEIMWEVAYADATLSAHELHVIRKLADLLRVPHASYIAAKLRARDRSRPA